MFCNKCGQKLPEGANFCLNCGWAVGNMNDEQQNRRKTVYEGEIHKCSNCGEILNSFTTKCPSCGYELRGNKAASSVQEFASKLLQMNDEKQKVIFIKNFPIPNAKEDILEFIILASSNIDKLSRGKMEDAWETKFEQAYKKAKLLFKEDNVFIEIQQIYRDTLKKLAIKKRTEQIRHLEECVAEMMPVLPNVIVVLGWLASIFVFIALSNGTINDYGFSIFQLIIVFDLVIGVFVIPAIIKCESNLPRLITTAGLIISIIVLIPVCIKGNNGILYNGNTLILIIDFIFSFIIFYKIMKERTSTNLNYDKGSFLIVVSSIILLVVIYLITSLIVFIGNRNQETDPNDNNYKNTTEYLDGNVYESTYNWSDGELSVYLPKPKSENGEIVSNSDSYFKIYVYKITKDDYETYVDTCEERGFIIESEEESNSYKAYNVSGYKVSISFDDEPKMIIILEAPMEMTDVSWPTAGVAKRIPKPKFDVGNITSNSTESFTIYVGDTSVEEFNDYVDKCMKKGFDYDYTRYDTTFYGENKKNIKVEVSYEGNNVMRIQAYDWN